MNDINHVVIVGRLTRDSELKYTNTGTAIAKISIAVNRRKKTGDAWEDEVNFFDVTIWGKTAEALNQYLVKGKQIIVEGELRQSKWEQDGQTRSKVEINAKNIQLVGSSGGSAGKASGGSEVRPSKQSHSSEENHEITEEFEDDIPF